MAQHEFAGIDEIGFVFRLPTQTRPVNVLRQKTPAFDVVGAGGGGAPGVVAGPGTRKIAGGVGKPFVSTERLTAVTLGRVLDSRKGEASSVSREKRELSFFYHFQ